MVKREMPTLLEGVDDSLGNISCKRQRSGNKENPMADTLSFNFINNDCQVHILSFLSTDDMNSFAICSRHCRKVRANQSLDQTRTATIVWTDNSAPVSLILLLIDVQNVFTGNRTRLKIEGSIRPMGIGPICPNLLQLPELTSLDCTFSNSPAHLRNIGIYCEPVLAMMGTFAPNLQEIDLSNVCSDVDRAIRYFSKTCPCLTKITWKRCSLPMICGEEFRDCKSLTHLTLDGATFMQYVSVSVGARRRLTKYFDASEFYLLMKCKRLQYLSITGATLSCIPYKVGRLDTLGMLIKMSRRHPTLKWLKSDLPPEDVAILQKDRPGITFLSS